MDLLRQLRQAYRTRRQQQTWQRFVQVMAMIVVFCTTYALILPAITLERSAECGLTEHTHSAQCYDSTAEIQPVHTHEDSCYETALICGLEEHPAHSHTEACSGLVETLICTETAADHVHQGTCYHYENGLICGQEETEGHSHEDSCSRRRLTCTLPEGSAQTDTQPVCGLVEHTHDDGCYPETEATEESTAPAEEATLPAEQLHTGTSEEGIYAQVSLDGQTAVPADAAVTITPMTEEDGAFADHASQVDALVEEQILGLTLLDISFYDSAGDYLSVGDTAQVTLTFDGISFGQNPVKVFHFVDGTPVELEQVSVSYTALAAEDDTEAIQTNLTFQTDGFSVFAIVEISERYQRITVTDPTTLDGNSYYIVSNNMNYVMLDSIYTETNMGLDKESFSGASEMPDVPLWTFTDTGDGTFYIHSSNGNYMVMEDTANDSAKVSVTKEVSEATKFTVTAFNGQAEISYTGTTNTPHYLNVYSGNQDFRGWKDSAATDDGSKVYLYQEKENELDTVFITDLAGKSFAVVNETNNMAMLATTNGNGLKAAGIKTVTIDGVKYIDGAGIPLWTFTQDGECAAGEYYIHTVIDETPQYLNLNSNQSLTLAETKMKFTVSSAGDTGKVYLRANGFNINKYGGENKFAGYSDWGNNEQMTLCLLTDIVNGFQITYDTYTITVYFEDILGNTLTVTPQAIEMEADEEINFAALAESIAAEVPGYMFDRAAFGNSATSSEVASVRSNVDGNAFRFYGPDYPAVSNQYYSKNQNVELFMIFRSDEPILHYNLNSPAASGWVDDADNNPPSIPSDPQNITAETGNIYTVAGKNVIDRFIADTFINDNRRQTEEDQVKNWNSTNGYSPGDAEYLPPGAEYEFLYWQAENASGSACYFEEDATVYLGDDGYIYATDIDGTEQKLKPGTTLTGQWRLISNVIFFFVNHGDTMLEGEDDQSITSTDSSYYTDIAAIGHIYNIDDPDAYVKNIIQQKTHGEIMSMFRANYDPNSTDTQLVVDFYKKIDGSTVTYEQADNYSEDLLEAAIAVYIQSQTGKTIMLDGAILDKEDITPENYKLYWYILKQVDTDVYAYHMDGVLVAKTQPMEIYKTFSGLTRDQAESIISNMNFPLYLIHTKDGTDVKDDYTTLEANTGQDGVYTVDGWQSTDSNIFKWTLQSVQGQRYAFEETGYELTGYECFSLVSVHYKDGTVKYSYSTDATYTDLDTTQGTITDLFASQPLEGGQIESVIFANFYTPEGTGMFSVSKVADTDGQVRLAGAEFTLTQGDTVIQTVKTNENGAAHFSGLSPGTYTLTETSPPPGYQQVDTQWTVEVEKTDSHVTVSIYEGTSLKTQLYDNQAGGIQEVYLVQNTPEDQTMTINKVFSNITEAEVAQLTGYCIEVQKNDDTPVQTLTLGNATPITGVMNGYTWTVSLDTGQAYQLVEKGFVHNSYLDTVVTATATETGKTAQALNVIKSADNATAYIPITKGDKAVTVEITNDYTNTFTLKILKVDATANNAPMGNVEFNIYGEFGEGGGESLTYTDDKGTEHTVYLMGSVVTGADGTVTYPGMRLSTGSRSFLYVIDEVATPHGYVKLSQPIVRSVDIDSQYYKDGVYTLTIENMQKDLIDQLKAKVSVTATKEWALPAGMTVDDYPDVTLHLYRKYGDNKAEDLGAVTLDGKNVSGTTAQGITYTVTDDWTVTWSGLPYAAENSDTRYEYFVAEDHLPGYSATYSTYLQTLTLDTGQVRAAQAKDSLETQLKRQITVTNTTGFELPDTGGFGTWWYSTFGFVLILACVWLYWRGLYKRKRGGADPS